MVSQSLIRISIYSTLTILILTISISGNCWANNASDDNSTENSFELPEDVALVTLLKGKAEFKNESSIKNETSVNSERMALTQITPFMKLMENDRIVLHAESFLRLVYFQGGLQENWTGAAEFKTGKDKSIQIVLAGKGPVAKSIGVDYSGLKSVPDILKAESADKIGGVDNSGSSSAGSVLPRKALAEKSSDFSVPMKEKKTVFKLVPEMPSKPSPDVSAPPMECVSDSMPEVIKQEIISEEETEIDKININYQKMRKLCVSDDVTPEMLAILKLVEHHETESIETFVKLAWDRLPDMMNRLAFNRWVVQALREVK